MGAIFTPNVIYRELKDQDTLDRDQISRIIQLSEIHNLKIDYAKFIDSGLLNRFSEAQLAKIKSLDGRSFQHKWQLKNELASEPEFTLYLPPQNEIQKNHNRVVGNKLNELYRTFVLDN